MKGSKKRFPRPILFGLIINILLIPLVALAHRGGLLESADNFFYDVFLSSRRSPVSDRILIVTLDEGSAKSLGRKIREFPREWYGKVLSNITEDGTEMKGEEEVSPVIGVDIDFSMQGNTQDDLKFADAINSSNSILPVRINPDEGQVMNPLPLFLEKASGKGFVNLVVDQDGICRRVDKALVEITKERKPIYTPHLAFSVYALSEDKEVDFGKPGIIQLDDLKVPLIEEQFVIPFAGPPSGALPVDEELTQKPTFQRISFAKVLKKQYDKGYFKGKIVLIGITHQSYHDYLPTAWKNRIFGKRVTMDGVEIHANILNSLLTKRFIFSPARKVYLGYLILAGALLGLIFLFLIVSPIYSAILLVILLCAEVFVPALLLSNNGYWIPPVSFIALTATIFASSTIALRRRELEEKAFVTSTFSKFVSRDVVKIMLNNPEFVNLKGKKETLSVLFSDIRGFTPWSEKTEPQKVSDILNEYFKEMTEIIFKNRGTLDKFMGDCVMVFFGNPLPDPEHAKNAVKTAVEMILKTDELNEKWKIEHGATLRAGIGIATGDMVVGNLGSDMFIDYTVIGDTVNLSSRLQSNAAGGEILINRATYEAVKEVYPTEQLAPIKVKGKAEPVEVFRVSMVQDTAETDPAKQG